MTLSGFKLKEHQTLLLILGASLAAYALALLALWFAGPASQPDFTRLPPVQWMPTVSAADGTATDLRYLLADAHDPSLVALPSPYGFSRAMWSRLALARRRDSHWPVADASLPAHSLPPFEGVLAQPALEPTRLAAALQPALELPAVPLEPRPDLQPARESVIHISGELQTRERVSAPTLPRIASAAPLRPTRVRAAVDRAGTVRYAVLERSCGNETVDARALQLSRQLRFEPLLDGDDDALTWGLLRFLWFTEPPPERE
jgi:TonB family protein